MSTAFGTALAARIAEAVAAGKRGLEALSYGIENAVVDAGIGGGGTTVIVQEVTGGGASDDAEMTTFDPGGADS